VNVDGVSIFKTSDKVRPPQALVVARSLLTSCGSQSQHEIYRFAKLKSWAATADACTFKVSKDGDKHKVTKDQVVFSTEMVPCTPFISPPYRAHFRAWCRPRISASC
jgi:hypothetical protein